MIIKTYPIGVYEENIYLLIDEKSKDACIVDPGGNAKILINKIEEANCNIKFILLTHGHFDHVEALKEVVSRFNVPVYINDIEIGFMKTDKTVYGEAPANYISIKDGDEISFAESKIKAIHTPGHTKGGMCYLYQNVLFSGDTLFAGSVGRSDFIGGDFSELISSIKTKLLVLDDNIKIYPGHMDSSTIGHEKLRNPYLQDEFDIF